MFKPDDGRRPAAPSLVGIERLWGCVNVVCFKRFNNTRKASKSKNTGMSYVAFQKNGKDKETDE